MATQVQAPVAAPVQQPAAAEPVKTKDSNGRVIEPFALHYTHTKALFNAQATSENSFVAALQKTAYVAASAIMAVAETIRNILAGIVDVAFIAPVNLVGSLFHKEEKKVEPQPQPQPQPEPQPEPAPKPVELKGWARFKAAVSHYASAFGAQVKAIPSHASNVGSAALSAIKAHPYRTAGVVVGAATLGTGYALGVPAMIGSKLGYGAAAASVI